VFIQLLRISQSLPDRCRVHAQGYVQNLLRLPHGALPPLIPRITGDFGIEGETIRLFVPDARVAFHAGQKMVTVELITKWYSIELHCDIVFPAKLPAAVALPPLPPLLDEISAVGS
jgi:hypothetical protein